MESRPTYIQRLVCRDGAAEVPSPSGVIPLQVMMTCLETAPVGVILLDDYFLKKKYPVKELRAIMQLAESGHAAGVLS